MTAASPFSVKVQVRTLLPPLEQAPDQTAVRPFVTLNVTISVNVAFVTMSSDGTQHTVTTTVKVTLPR